MLNLQNKHQFELQTCIISRHYLPPDFVPVAPQVKISEMEEARIENNLLFIIMSRHVTEVAKNINNELASMNVNESAVMSIDRPFPQPLLISGTEIIKVCAWFPQPRVSTP